MKFNETLQLVATDLDGTFLKNDKSISKENIETLNNLGKRNIIRAIATGRNFKKVQEVIPDSIPFDYVAFSSGAGVVHWKTKELIYSQNISIETSNELSHFFQKRRISFHIFKAVPNNHYCYYYKGAKIYDEFNRFFEFHNAYSKPLPRQQALNEDFCQFLLIFPNRLSLFIDFKQELERNFPDIKIIRTSSPLNTGYIWMEIFHKDVSKGNAIRFLCNYLNIKNNTTLGIGNDYNDLDLLDFTHFSYITANAPEILKAQFNNSKSNQESAFSYSVEQHL